jgi:serine-type D-Ala-D-Ala carboxypeptidase/endopeptidase
MKRVHLLFAVFAIYANLAAAQDDPGENRKMDTIAGNAAKVFFTNTPAGAFSVGIINHGQIYLRNYGIIEKGADQKTSGDNLYEIGSITKTFTSLILAHAVLEKRVNMDDDIRKFLPGEYPNLAFSGKPVQLIHLVNWTSGMPNNIPVDPAASGQLPFDSMATAFVHMHSRYNKEKFFADLHQVRLDTFPGLNPRHSNAAAQLLAYILENIYQQPFSQLIEKYITKPLRMIHTYLLVPQRQENLRVKGYSERGEPMPFLSAYDAPAFGIKSTIEDMARYVRYQLDEHDPAVKLTHQITLGDINYFAWGWNWFMNKRADDKLKIHEDGTTFGFTANVLLYPEQGFGVVLLTNECDRNSNDRLIKITDKIYDESNYTPAERASLGFGYSANLNRLLSELSVSGFDQAIAATTALKNKDATFNLKENELNTWAYFLRRNVDKEKALEIFKLNTFLYPQSSNAFNSLAECYAILGNKMLAIENYKRSLELDPHNTDSAEQLEKLK